MRTLACTGVHTYACTRTVEFISVRPKPVATKLWPGTTGIACPRSNKLCPGTTGIAFPINNKLWPGTTGIACPGKLRLSMHSHFTVKCTVSVQHCTVPVGVQSSTGKHAVSAQSRVWSSALVTIQSVSLSRRSCGRTRPVSQNLRFPCCTVNALPMAQAVY